MAIKIATGSNSEKLGKNKYFIPWPAAGKKNELATMTNIIRKKTGINTLDIFSIPPLTPLATTKVEINITITIQTSGQ